MILVFGRSGQVARELARHEPSARFLARTDADLSDPTACFEAIRKASPSAVINAAAYTAVDRAEEEEALAAVANSEAPGAMSEACAEIGIPFVHISTDYVFNGGGSSPFAPDAETNPINAYGRSKLAGENAIRASGAIHAILRSSWVFSAHGANFVKTMLRLSDDRQTVAVVGDQVGGPTPASALAQACLTIAKALPNEPGKTGTYHFAGEPDVSWADFARAIFQQAGKSTTVEAIPTAAYPTSAKRPANSRLDCAALAEFDLVRPDWRAGLSHVLTELERQ